MERETTPGALFEDEKDDDIPVGRILSRKDALLFLSGAGMVFLAGCGGSGASSPVVSSSSSTATSSSSSSSSTTASSSSSSSAISTNCVAFPEETQGPYWVDEMLNRSDVRSDPTTGSVKAGIPLTLNLILANVSDSCGLISGATIDIWHCDALGKYSDISSEGTSGQKYLRGFQTTDSSGAVQFVTLYPGWYSGRTTHIHFRVHFTANGKYYNLASQLFFDESVTSSVYASQSPYSSHGQKTWRTAAITFTKASCSSRFPGRPQQAIRQPLLWVSRLHDAFVKGIYTNFHQVHPLINWQITNPRQRKTRPLCRTGETMPNENKTPLVGIIMGSQSDWETMRHAHETLDKFAVAHECRIVSAHRTPDLLATYAGEAEAHGLEVIIAGAGGAAHLPGMAAAFTVLPVLGVPVESHALKGMDSLLSIAQMPGGIPVGTLAIGKPGAINAALLAIAILANSRPELRAALHRFRQEQTATVLATELPL